MSFQDDSVFHILYAITQSESPHLHRIFLLKHVALPNDVRLLTTTCYTQQPNILCPYRDSTY